MSCKKCNLHKYRRKIVYGRGEIPADILFIGEGPGKSEDLIGEPFVGPSGKLLNRALQKAAEIAKRPIPSYYITNIVACRPTDYQGGPNRQPTEEEAWACWPRLERKKLKVKPKQIVLLGAVAKKFVLGAWPTSVCLVHPAYLLRLGGVESTQYRTFCRTLAEVFKSIPRRVKRGKKT